VKRPEDLKSKAARAQTGPIQSNQQKNKNIQQPKVWPGSPSAHRSAMGDSPLYSGGSINQSINQHSINLLQPN
jgi:hypothetical protein